MNKREEFEKALEEWYTGALEYADRGKLISKERRTEAYSEVLRLYDALAQEHDKLVERSVGAMEIAEGAEGYEKVPVDCPMLGAVSELRSKYDAARQPSPPQECQAFCEECGIQKHVLVPQGNDYTDLVCQLCFGNTCRFSGAPQTPAPQGEMPPALDYETEHAIVEGYQNHASQEYFYARVALHDSPLNRRIFEAGFKAAVRKGSELARAVRQAEQMRNLTTQIAAATPQVAEGDDGTKKRDVFLAIANLEVAALEGEGKDFPYPPLVKARRAIHKLCGVNIEVSGTDQYEAGA